MGKRESLFYCLGGWAGEYKLLKKKKKFFLRVVLGVRLFDLLFLYGGDLLVFIRV